MHQHLPLDTASLQQLFTEARSVHTFFDRPVTDQTIYALYDLLKMGPTAFNSQPGRYLFLRSPEAKRRLLPHMMDSNQAKTLKAPLTVIVAIDSRFYEQLDRLFHEPNVKRFYVDNAALAERAALRNGTLQGAYLLMAARALGLSVGPMSGFNNEGVDREFFADSSWRSNFIVNMGYFDGSPLNPRNRRLVFDEAAKIL